jgi:predicted Zn-dependent protease
MNRIEMLNQILSQNPKDAFARYGLAMEHSKAGDIKTALTEFDTLLADNPSYIAGYQMAAQMLASAERPEEARSYLERGIHAAQQAGNQHARSEMESLLEEISR